jgi:D-alanyl-D-alanine carboxypeptidase/D-alanyl-D-alanine-endopeptidase (penicillin-binding protein 4)
MRGTAAQKNLHGKTGTLSVASNLSGYVTSRNGEWLVFSMLMNKKDWIDVTAAHAAQDAIGVALARSKPAGKIVWTPSPAPSPS